MIVKICGLTRADDALAAARLGADWLGLNFWPGSKRHVSLAAARAIADFLGASRPRLVGVFVNADAAVIDAAVAEVGLDLVQLHGDEAPAFAARWSDRLVKALPAGADLEPWRGTTILLDTPTAGHGGSGRSYDWTVARAAVDAGHQVIVAGGLTPENVAGAIRAARPAGVDVAGGVESSPGIKDPDKLRAFIHAAKGPS